MSLSQKAASAARFVVLSSILALAASLSACGTDGGKSDHLPAGPPTSAAPGNLVLYVAMSYDNRIDAYRLGSDGLLPSTPFSSIHVFNPRRLALNGNTLYVSLGDQVASIDLGPNGELPAGVSSHSLTREDYEPVDIIVRDDILYVAASGLENVESFELLPNGDIPTEPTNVGTSDVVSDYQTLAFNGDRLYAASRNAQYIDLFVLEQDGNVPDLAEQQDPQDRVPLPEDIKIRDNILYVTAGNDRGIRAYRLQANGWVPNQEDSKTAAEAYYTNMLLDGDILYACAYNEGHVDLFHIEPNGMLPEERPYFKTEGDTASYPNKLLLFDGILYVAQSGLDRVDAFVLDSQGIPSQFPTSSTTPAPNVKSLPLDMVMYQLP